MSVLHNISNHLAVDPDFINGMDEPVGKTHPSSLKEPSCGGTDARAVTIFHIL